MAKYDPNWLMKLKAKDHAKAMARLSHIEDTTKEKFHYSTMLCGKGWGAKGHPSITVVSVPSVTSLPTCYTCRIKFLESIGVSFDEKGYPIV